MSFFYLSTNACESWLLVVFHSVLSMVDTSCRRRVRRELYQYARVSAGSTEEERGFSWSTLLPRWLKGEQRGVRIWIVWLHRRIREQPRALDLNNISCSYLSSLSMVVVVELRCVGVITPRWSIAGLSHSDIEFSGQRAAIWSSHGNISAPSPAFPPGYDA